MSITENTKVKFNKTYLKNQPLNNKVILLQDGSGMAASWYDMSIQKMLQRLQKCIYRNSHYVEKLINYKVLKAVKIIIPLHFQQIRDTWYLSEILDRM